MVQFNELRITPDSLKLIIDVSVPNNGYNDDIIISKVIIDTQDTFVANGPSSKPIYVFNNVENTVTKTYGQPDYCNCNPVLVEEADDAYCFTYEDKKNLRLELTNADIQISLCDTMFFVYVFTEGEYAPDTPEYLKKDITLGIVVNLYPYYQQAMYYIKELERDCKTPKGLIDLILRFKAVELATITGNYVQAIKYWNKFFRGHLKKSISCGCNG